MAKSTVRQPVKPTGPRPRWVWPSVAAGAILLVGIVVLATIRSLALTQLDKVLNKEVGQAATWEVRVGLLAVPRLAMGLSVSGSVHGVSVQPKNTPQIKDLLVEATGLVADIKGKRLKSAEKIDVEVTLDEKAVGTYLQQRAVTTKILEDPSVVFGQGDLELSGTLDSSALSWLSGGNGKVQVTAHATPSLRPPATVGLMVDKLRLVTNSGDQDVPVSALGGVLSRDLCLDMGRFVHGLTLTNATVDKAGFKVKGTVDASQLGQPSAGPPPAAPQGESTTT